MTEDEERAALEAYFSRQDADDSGVMVHADEIQWGLGTESSAMKERRIRLAREREEATLRRVKERVKRLTRARG